MQGHSHKTAKAPAAIFELGLNHMGDFGRACRMVDILLAQGATHITIQAAIDFGTTTRDTVSIKAVESHCLSLKEVIAVLEHGRSAGAQMGVAVLDPNHVESFVEAGVSFFKVLSSDLTYTPLHFALVRTGLPCYLSTGLATLEDIKRAVDIIHAALPKADVRLIHTVLQIPTPAAMLNLSNIPFLIEKFNIPVAYGQHSDIQDALPAAIAAGAETVFVYVAEELSPLLPDGPHAMLCRDAQALLKKLARVRIMMGAKERTLSVEEQERRISIRRSIVAERPITKGESVTIEKLAFKRPGTGYAPWDASHVLGSRAKKDYLPDEDI
jgi:N,N'-diacetyllegionaminate synthase